MVYFDRPGSSHPLPPDRSGPSAPPPGHIRKGPDTSDDDLEINVRDAADKSKIWVMNVGDRPIQVGSHAHLDDVNPHLLFFDEDAIAGLNELVRESPTSWDLDAIKRKAAQRQDRDAAHWGYRFDIESGASLRFAPSSAPGAEVAIVKIKGNRVVPGIRLGKTQDDGRLDAASPNSSPSMGTGRS